MGNFKKFLAEKNDKTLSEVDTKMLVKKHFIALDREKDRLQGTWKSIRKSLLKLDIADLVDKKTKKRVEKTFDNFIDAFEDVLGDLEMGTKG